jgi:hypothetical protein
MTITGNEQEGLCHQHFRCSLASSDGVSHLHLTLITACGGLHVPTIGGRSSTVPVSHEYHTRTNWSHLCEEATLLIGKVGSCTQFRSYLQ